MQRGFDEDKLVHLSVLVVFGAVLMRRYQVFGAVIEVSDMVRRCVQNYEL